MFADDGPIEIDQRAGHERRMAFGKALAQEVAIVPGRHEADLLRFRLFGGLEAQGAGALANCGLGHAAERKVETLEQIGGEPPKEVGLILGAVESAMQ